MHLQRELWETKKRNVREKKKALWKPGSSNLIKTWQDLRLESQYAAYLWRKCLVGRPDFELEICSSSSPADGPVTWLRMLLGSGTLGRQARTAREGCCICITKGFLSPLLAKICLECLCTGPAFSRSILVTFWMTVAIIPWHFCKM